MHRGFLLAVIVPLMILRPLAFLGEERREIELQLKQSYEGKLAALHPMESRTDLRLDIPKEEAQDSALGVRVVLLLEQLELENKELKLWGRRVHFFQDVQGAIQGMKDERKRYRLRWENPQLEEARLREWLGGMFPLLNQRPEDWEGYWPPEKPESPPGRPLGEQASVEIAPGVFTSGTDVRPPRCEFCPEPEYPEAIRLQKGQGVVELRAVLTKAGRVGGIRLVKSSGESLLDQEAVRTVSRWRFQPAIRDGEAVGILMELEISFRLY